MEPPIARWRDVSLARQTEDATAQMRLNFAPHQNDPNTVPSTIATTSDTMAPTIATITMSR